MLTGWLAWVSKQCSCPSSTGCWSSHTPWHLVSAPRHAHSASGVFLARLGATRGGSPGIFGYTGGQAASGRPAAVSRSCIARSGSSDCGASDISDHGSPAARSRSRHRRDGQRVWLDRIELVPAEGRRYLRARSRPHRPGAEDRLVWRILVVVDEDALAALLLPPGRGHQLRPPSLQLAGHRHGRAAHLVRRPARLEPDVDVDAAIASRLRHRAHRRARQTAGGPPAPPPESSQTSRLARGRGRCAARPHAPGRPRATARRGSRCSRG